MCSLGPVTGEITVFSGSAHQEFAEEMCQILGVELYHARTTRFSNDCLQVQLRANCRQRDVYVVQSLVPPVQENLFELLLMLDAARGASAAHITAVIPHFAYARSDKKDAPRISIGARLVADMLAAAGATRVLTMALHAPQVHGFFSVPVDHLNAIHVLADHFRSTDLANTVVVSPDLGNAKMATQFARVLSLPVAAGSKQRLADDTVVIDRIVGDVRDRDVIVLDDEIATAGSIIELLRKLREEGARRISVACTHGLFTGPAIERLRAESDIVEIVSTNTVPLGPEKRLPNMVTRSVAPLFAEAVHRTHVGESISSLFSDELTYG
jgi:ribose-phosphate pyrophosphokinase